MHPAQATFRPNPLSAVMKLNYQNQTTDPRLPHSPVGSARTTETEFAECFQPVKEFGTDVGANLSLQQGATHETYQPDIPGSTLHLRSMRDHKKHDGAEDTSISTQDTEPAIDRSGSFAKTTSKSGPIFDSRPHEAGLMTRQTRFASDKQDASQESDSIFESYQEGQASPLLEQQEQLPDEKSKSSSVDTKSIIMLEGWVYKRGNWMNPSFKKRWFVMHEDRDGKGVQISYYKSDRPADRVHPLGCLSLEGMKAEVHADTGKKSRRFSFSLTPSVKNTNGNKTRTMVCAVETFEERRKWTEKLATSRAKMAAPVSAELSKSTTSSQGKNVCEGFVHVRTSWLGSFKKRWLVLQEDQSPSKCMHLSYYKCKDGPEPAMVRSYCACFVLKWSGTLPLFPILTFAFTLASFIGMSLLGWRYSGEEHRGKGRRGLCNHPARRHQQ
jgi:hypothetical protein